MKKKRSKLKKRKPSKKKLAEIPSLQKWIDRHGDIISDQGKSEIQYLFSRAIEGYEHRLQIAEDTIEKLTIRCLPFYKKDKYGSVINGGNFFIYLFANIGKLFWRK